MIDNGAAEADAAMVEALAAVARVTGVSLGVAKEALDALIGLGWTPSADVTVLDQAPLAWTIARVQRNGDLLDLSSRPRRSRLDAEDARRHAEMYSASVADWVVVAIHDASLPDTTRDGPVPVLTRTPRRVSRPTARMCP